MRFLNTHTLILETFESRPSYYACLSYAWDGWYTEAWTKENDVATTDAGHTDSQTVTVRSQVEHACSLARQHDLAYIWIDALCVSKVDPPNSTRASFETVWNSTVCFALLSDVRIQPQPQEDGDGWREPSLELEQELAGSRWFARAWTLQELVACKRLEIFDGQWNHIVTKASESPRPWLDMLSRVSKVDTAVLADRDKLFTISIGRRLSWAADRVSWRPEDAAYALVGICDVVVTPLYGEGQRSAFVRLQEAILHSQPADLSVLAWSKANDIADISVRHHEKGDAMCSIFADSAADFKNFSLSADLATPFLQGASLTINSREVCVEGQITLLEIPAGDKSELIWQLQTSSVGFPEPMLIGMLLRPVGPGVYARADPSRIAFPIPETPAATMSLSRIFIRHAVCMEDKLLIRRPRPYQLVWKWLQQVSDEDGEPADSKLGRLAIHDGPPTAGNSEAAHKHGPLQHRFSRLIAEETIDNNTTQSTCGSETVMGQALQAPPAPRQMDRHLSTLQSQLIEPCLAAWNRVWADLSTQLLRGSSAANVTAPDKLTAIGNPKRKLHAFSFSIRRKRRRMPNYEEAAKGDSDGDYAAETDDEEPDTFMVRAAQETQQKQLACPFYKLDPARFDRCLWFSELLTIQDVEQHLTLNHALPAECPVCYATFGSAAQRDEHIKARTCKLRQPENGMHLGVSQDQETAILHLHGSDDSSPIDVGLHWLRVWDILFRERPQPDTAFLLSAREKKACAFKAFWRNKGAGLIKQELKEQGELHGDSEGEEEALAALQFSVFEGMADRLGASAHSAPGAVS
jgi:hypothetical protein